MVKSIVFLVLVLTPMTALACGGGGCSFGCGGGTWLGATLVALLAVLGWWVLRHVEKDKSKGHVRWAGLTVGWTLVVIGLLGFLCSAVSHGKGNSKCGSKKGAYGKKFCPYSDSAQDEHAEEDREHPH